MAIEICLCVNWSFKEHNGSEQIKLCLPLCLMSYILFATVLELRKINSRLTANLKFSRYITNESEKIRLHSSNMEIESFVQSGRQKPIRMVDNLSKESLLVIAKFCFKIMISLAQMQISTNNINTRRQ